MRKYRKYRTYLEWFSSEDLRKDLKSKSIRGGINTSASQFTTFCVNLISTIILARILLPSDFGLIGMVTAFTGFAALIQDMGLSMAVIQKEKITHRQVSNLFWINVLICSLLALLFVLLSPLIVALYHHDLRLYPIILSYAAGIAISGLSIQHNALLSRKMLFGRIAKSTVFSAVLSVAFGIIAGFLGLGYWAIVVLNLSSIIFNTCFLWIYCNWRPFIPTRNQSVKDFLHFGAAISGFNIANYFSRNSDDILIGKYIGPNAVGIYSKAYQLLMLPINQIRNPLMTVALPAISALKNDAVRYVEYYKKYVFLLAFFSIPLVAFLAIFSKELILIVLGDKWLECSPIFQLLAIAGVIQPVSSSGGLVMISKGQTKKYFIVGCLSSIITVIGFIIGIRWGIKGTVFSFIITTYIILVPTLLYAYKGTSIKLWMFLKEISLPLIHTCIIGLVLLEIRVLLSHLLPGILIFLLLAPLGGVVYYFSWKLYPLGRRKFDNIQEVKFFIIKSLNINKFSFSKRLQKVVYSNSND